MNRRSTTWRSGPLEFHAACFISRDQVRTGSFPLRLALDPWRPGFTLIELMIVASIIGILAAIAIPKFASMVIKAKQAELKGRLGAVRSAISIYYSDNEGIFPQQSNELNPYTDPGGPDEWLHCLHRDQKYMGKLNLYTSSPVIPHDESAKFISRGAVWVLTQDFYGSNVWMYRVDTGQLWINCTHVDSGGRRWSTW